MRSSVLRRGAPAALILLLGMTWTAPSVAHRQAPPPTAGDSSLIDISQATVVTPAKLSLQERTAVRVLIEEVQKRTNVRMPVATTWPADSVPVIAVGPLQTSATWAAPGLRKAGTPAAPGREGYRLVVDTAGRGAPTVLVLGADTRGMLFGVGRLLREMRLDRGSVRVTAGISLISSPHVALRGHQLGYRPKTNAYDAWDVAMWEQYIRDLAIFGSNAIELIPPRSDDAAESPHFPLPQIDMMVEMSRLADEYSQDVWIWYPALDKDYGDPTQVEFALKEWGEVFAKLPRIDAIFVPGGDPGHTQPKHLMALLERQTASLRKHHPKAEMWVSPQGFTKAWMDEFYGILATEPTWLAGLVFGPQVRDSLPVLRAKAPKRYRIRHYPDITHSLRSQYPVPDWDVAHALTSNREQINPRPEDQALIFRSLLPHVSDFITYSEGANDDVNKIVWSGLGWDPQTDVAQILREYSRFFISPRYADPFAEGLLALERNWRGPLAANKGVDATLEHFQALERAVPPHVLRNWRFQQALYRACYDAHVRARLLHETAIEERALERLRAAKAGDARQAIADARQILAEADDSKPAPELRLRVYTLAEALFQSIRQQLSVSRYKAIAVGRGATLDSFEMPLNNRGWLVARFDEALKLETEEERSAAIDRIVRWTDPGPGGYYDDLGNPAQQPHLVRGLPYEEDPQRFKSTLTGFGYRPDWRLSWMTHAESFWDTPLHMRYTKLDPAAQYRLRVVYAGDVFSMNTLIRLVANDKYEIHPPLRKPSPVAPIEFDIPVEATRGGELTLTFSAPPGMGSAGRGNQIAEVWLTKK